jgi:uncharacterized repeat protein (TIGR03803 family)
MVLQLKRGWAASTYAIVCSFCISGLAAQSAPAVAAVEAEVTVVHSFASAPVTGLTDGRGPGTGPIRALDGNLYGTTYYGGQNIRPGITSGGGTVYRITPGGAASVLHSFGADGADGVAPGGLMQASDGNLYGVTSAGGTYGFGTIFRLTLGGTYTTLYSFGATAGDGRNPHATLVEGPDGKLYGATDSGGAHNGGTLFRISRDGSYFRLHSFSDDRRSPGGSRPDGGLVVGEDGAFYGVTTLGGEYGAGTFYRMTAAGTVTVIHEFGACPEDSAGPIGALTLGPDGNFYGVSDHGGSYPNSGTVFVISPAGETRVLYAFPPEPHFFPWVGVAQGLTVGRDGNLYGVTVYGGRNVDDFGGRGTAFMITPQGAFTTLHSFGGSGDGAHPITGAFALGSDGSLYGVTWDGGTADAGTVYKLSVTGATPAVYPGRVIPTCQAAGPAKTAYGAVNLTLLLLYLLMTAVRATRAGRAG